MNCGFDILVRAFAGPVVQVVRDVLELSTQAVAPQVECVLHAVILGKHDCPPYVISAPVKAELSGDGGLGGGFGGSGGGGLGDGGSGLGGGLGGGDACPTGGVGGDGEGGGEDAAPHDAAGL